MLAVNGEIIAQGSQFSLNEVEVVTATIDIEDFQAHRTKSNRNMQATTTERYHRIEVGLPLSGGKFREVQDVFEEGLEVRFKIPYHTPEEEVRVLKGATGYLRRSRTRGYSPRSAVGLTVTPPLLSCTRCAI